MFGNPDEALRRFADACVRCGLCARTDCGNYAPGTPNLGDIAESLLSGDETWRHFPFTCALCNRCTVKCPAGLVAADMSKPARAVLLGQHPEIRPAYRKFRTDLKYNLFSALAAKTRGDIEEVSCIEGAADLDDAANTTAFFPGCALYAYAPELTARVHEWLRSENIAARMLTFCCGATFYDPGFFDEFAAYRERAQAFLRDHGITRVIVSCTHCNHVLPELFEGAGIELISLPQLLVEHSMMAPTTEPVSFHDACYDRETGAFGDAARALFANADIRPMAHEREQTMCCGGGGLVSAYAPDYCAYRRNQRLAEIDAVDADLVISTCFSCVNSLQRGIGATRVQHYLEPIFGVTVDWAQVYASVDALYADAAYEQLCAGEEKTFE